MRTTAGFTDYARLRRLSLMPATNQAPARHSYRSRYAMTARASRSRPLAPDDEGVPVNPALTTLFGAIGHSSGRAGGVLPVIRSQGSRKLGNLGS